MSNCNCHTKIITDGSGQLGRYLKALDPAYAPIDDRSIKDLLVFAKRYAAQVRFYDVPGEELEDGIKPAQRNWREFFRRDMAVIAASIGVLDITNMKAEYDELRGRLDEDPSVEKFGAMLALSIAVATRIDRWYTVAIPGHPLRSDLDMALDANLRELMRQIMAYEEGFKSAGFKTNLNLKYDGIENDAAWGLTTAVDPDASIYAGGTPGDKLRNAALYADDIFNGFYGFLQSLIDGSDKYFTYAMEAYPAHQPHMALFITFLKMFSLAQEQMNGLTSRMLDYYYKEVLRLTAKDAQPDKAHVVFELAKDVLTYDVTKDTPLSAGKDGSNKDLLYSTTTDLVVNQAKIKELKTIFIEKQAGASAGAANLLRNIYARPVANSADGLGAEFTVANPKWPTLGKGGPLISQLSNPCSLFSNRQEEKLTPPPAQTGFAIASPQFLLQGGNRLLAINIKNFGTLFSNAASLLQQQKPLFEVWLTGEKGWVKITQMRSDDADLNMMTEVLESGNFKKTEQFGSSSFFKPGNDFFSFYLPPSQEAIVPYNTKIHEGAAFATTNPVMQILLSPELVIPENIYRSVKLENVIILAKVGSITPEVPLVGTAGRTFTGHFDGLKTLVLQNETGIIAPGKPFHPFTAYPGQGKSFYIGSDEIFNKAVFELTINIQKVQQAGGTIQGGESQGQNEFRLHVLEDKSWVKLSDDEGSDFSQSDLFSNVLLTPKAAPLGNNVTDPYWIKRVPIENVSEWTLQTGNGFFRLDNLVPVSPNERQSFLQASQDLAPELEIKEISISYLSWLMTLVNGIDQVFHVYPFGVAEVYVQKAAAVIASPVVNVEAQAESFTASHKVMAMDTEKLFQAFNPLVNKAATPGGSAKAVVTTKAISAAQTLPEIYELLFGKDIDFATLDKQKDYLLLMQATCYCRNIPTWGLMKHTTGREEMWQQYRCPVNGRWVIGKTLLLQQKKILLRYWLKRL